MSFSYLSSGPGSSDRSWIRLRIGDNSSSNYKLEDEEIDVLLADYGSKWAAAAAGARSIAAGFAREVTKQVGKLRISMAEASQHYHSLARALDLEADLNSGGAWVGGTSKADKKTQTDDTDWPGEKFSVGQFDNTDTSVNARNG